MDVEQARYSFYFILIFLTFLTSKSDCIILKNRVYGNRSIKVHHDGKVQCTVDSLGLDLPVEGNKIYLEVHTLGWPCKVEVSTTYLTYVIRNTCCEYGK